MSKPELHLVVAEMGGDGDWTCKRCGFKRSEFLGRECNGALADDLTTELLDHGYGRRDEAE